MHEAAIVEESYFDMQTIEYPEHRLWRAVLHAYIRDIIQARDVNQARRLAAWAVVDRGFEAVCEFSGFDSDVVRDKVREIMRDKWECPDYPKMMEARWLSA